MKTFATKGDRVKVKPEFVAELGFEFGTVNKSQKVWERFISVIRDGYKAPRRFKADMFEKV